MIKKFTLLSVLLMLSVFSFAQYSYLKVTCNEENPGGLNNDEEYVSSLTTGWNNILMGNSTLAWSPNQTLPFAFNFNGNNFTSYKVSSTGVLTFDLTAVSVPDSINIALPTSKVPNNSICLWGIIGRSGDELNTKTFGTAPNRQEWIFFASFTKPAIASSNTNYTYWAIVLEETTNNIYVVDERTYSNTGLSLTVGVQIDSTLAYQALPAANVNSATTTTALANSSDNQYFVFNTALKAYDVRNKSCILKPKYNDFPYKSITGGPYPISGSMTNLGTVTITTLDLNYSVDGGSPVTASISPSNFQGGKCSNYTHPTPWTPASTGFHTIKVWTSNPNANADQNTANDTVTAVIYVYGVKPAKHRVVFEEATGTWCGWCPRGTVFMDSIANVYPDNTIVIAAHGGSGGEPMQLAGYSDMVSNYIGGYPSVLVNRGINKDASGNDLDPQNAFTYYNAHSNDFGLGDVDMTVNYNGGIATVDATITSAVDITGDFRLACVFTEDHVTGSGDNVNTGGITNTSDYDQVNYYSGGGQGLLRGAGHSWDLETDPVYHSVMEYRFIPREVVGGFDGIQGALPSTLTAGGIYHYTFNSYAIPGNYNAAHMYAHVFLMDGEHGLIMNGTSMPVIATNVSDKSAGQYSFSLYPNPAKDKINIELNFKESDKVSLTITDAIGKVCMIKEMGMLSGFNRIPVDVSSLPSGTYFISLTGENGRTTSKFVK